MLGALGAVLLLAAPIKVAVPAFTSVGFDSALAEAYSEHFTTLLGRDGSLKLTSQKDIAQMLGFERQKQLLGCSESSNSCLAELAGALGVDAILSVTISKSGSSYTATLRVLRTRDGANIASETERLKSEDALQDWLDAQAPVLASRVRVAFGGVEQTSPTPAPTPFIRWVPAIGGAVLAATGAVLFGLSKGKASELRTTMFVDRAAAESVATSGRGLEGAGVALLITGGVAIAASAAWVFIVPTGEVQVAVAPMPGGGTALVGGTF